VAMRRYLDDEVDKPYPKQQNLTEVAAESDGATAGAAEPETDGGATTLGAGSDGEGDTASAGSTSDSGSMAVLNSGESPECPDCGAFSLYFSEGCKTCESCGWSEC